MPFRSEAQRKKFLTMVAEGKISQATFDEWERDTKGLDLPKRSTPEKPRKEGDAPLKTSLGEAMRTYTQKRFGIKK
jgi:hypothetical protein